MILQILGSSSAGNCYILTSDTGERMLIECGIRWASVLQAISYKVDSVAGCLITHEHGDHSKEVASCLKAGIEVYTSGGTADALGLKSGVMLHRMAEQSLVRIGSYSVRPFAAKHDAAEPFGYLISHPEMGVMVFATDTYYLPYRFKNLSHIMIECNYSEEILMENVRAGKLPHSVRNRILQSHMSLANCISTLQANDMSKINNIILLHLSEGNSDAAAFQAEVAKQTGKSVIVASKGLTINLDKTPF